LDILHPGGEERICEFRFGAAKIGNLPVENVDAFRYFGPEFFKRIILMVNALGRVCKGSSKKKDRPFRTGGLS